jgi:hypothetical protein
VRSDRLAPVALCLALGVIVWATLLSAPLKVAGAENNAWCLICGAHPLSDVVANIALFVPLGWGMAVWGRSGMTALLTGAALSSIVELVQWSGVAGPRSPAVADLFANAAGTGAGWLLLGSWRSASSLRGREAARVGLVWGAVVLMVLGGTAFGLQPIDMPRAATTATRVGTRTYSPGFGYYDGQIVGAWVNGVRAAYPGYGPLVLEMTIPGEALQLSLELARLDPVGTKRVAAFVHAADDTVPHAILAQRGEVFEFTRATTAEHAGFAAPMLSTHVRPRVHGPPTRISAAYTQGTLMLDVDDARGVSRHQLHLTPLLGWALLQSAIATTSPGASAVHTVWLALLFGPLGWLLGRGGRWWAFSGAGLALSLAPIVALTLRMHPPSVTDAALTLSCYAIGAWLGRVRTPHGL